VARAPDRATLRAWSPQLEGVFQLGRLVPGDGRRRRRGGEAMIVELDVRTRAQRELQDITSQVQRVVSDRGVEEGTCHVYVPHTTAGLTLNENWDPDVRGDLVRALEVLVPDIRYRHGEGNSPAHLMSTLVGASETLLVKGGRLVLGSWQGLYLAEFDGPRQRRVLVKVVSDSTPGV
jgi:secondary thiamine-phosphate synthase enzyme